SWPSRVPGPTGGFPLANVSVGPGNVWEALRNIPRALRNVPQGPGNLPQPPGNVGSPSAGILPAPSHASGGRRSLLVVGPIAAFVRGTVRLARGLLPARGAAAQGRHPELGELLRGVPELAAQLGGHLRLAVLQRLGPG